VPRQGVVVEGVKGVKCAPMLAKMYENGEKTSGFAHFFAYKSLKTPFFAQKYEARYTPEMFFEEYINLKFFVLLKTLWSYTWSKYQKSYTPPATRIRVKQ
jgi:hypothetical protein